MYTGVDSDKNLSKHHIFHSLLFIYKVKSTFFQFHETFFVFVFAEKTSKTYQHTDAIQRKTQLWPYYKKKSLTPPQ